MVEVIEPVSWLCVSVRVCALTTEAFDMHIHVIYVCKSIMQMDCPFEGTRRYVNATAFSLLLVQALKIK